MLSTVKGRQGIMSRTKLLAATAALLLAAAPAAADHHGGGNAGHQGGGNYGHQSGGNFGANAGHQGSGSPFAHGGNAQWGSFQHHEAPVRVYPHRFQGSVFPTPRGWHGDIHNFEHDHWHGGDWRHSYHNGHFGWWWVVGPDWYFYDQPVYPYPDSYTPPGEIPGWWYWCDAYQEYYPYVTVCPSGWQRVLPRD
jgi:hypothetical protein